MNMKKVIIFFLLFTLCGSQSSEINSEESTDLTSTTVNQNTSTRTLKIAVYDDSVTKKYQSIDITLKKPVNTKWEPDLEYGADDYTIPSMEIGELGEFIFSYDKNSMQIPICFSPTSESKGDLGTIFIVLNDNNIEIDGLPVQDIVIKRNNGAIELLEDNSYPECNEAESSPSTTKNVKKKDCVLDTETRFEIEITNNSVEKKSLGLYFYISGLFDAQEDEIIKTSCVSSNEKSYFYFNFDLNNKPTIGQYGDGTQDWYDVCYQSTKELFEDNEKIIFTFTDNEIFISSRLIYDRTIDRNTGLVTFLKEDKDKPTKYCDNIDLETSLPSTTTTTTLPDNVTIEFINCIDLVKDDKPFKLDFRVYAGDNEIQDIKYRQIYLNVDSSGSFNSLGLDLPRRGSYSDYNLEYSFDSSQINNWTKELIITVQTKDGGSITNSCKNTIVVTNPPKTTTTTTTSSTTSTSTTTTTVLTNLYPDTPPSSTWYRFSGSGDDVLDISSIGTDVMIASVEHNGSSNFAITALGSGLEYQSLKINEIGSYSGVISINFENDRNYYLEINADGNWEIVIKPIASAQNFDSQNINGSGDMVLEAYELKSSDILTFTHTGSSNFAVIQYRCNGSYNGLLINEIGAYSGNVRTDSGTCYLEINADGDWSISK